MSDFSEANPEGQAATYQFQYGTATTHGPASFAVLRLTEPTAGDMSEPENPETAVLRLRAQLDAAGKATALLIARITRLEGELKEIRPARESLRECLGAFTEASPGWYQSAYVPAADFRGWQADAGL